MRRGSALLLLTAASAAGQPAKSVALSKPTVPAVKQYRIAPQTFRDLEKRFDTRLETLVPNANEPVDVLGPTRGVYVDGCCIVFTTVVNLVRAQELSPFLREIPQQLADQVHQRRMERLPLLEKAMDEMLHAMAMTFIQVPSDQRVVLAVRLYYASWEDTTGMPAQIMMRATRAGVQLNEITKEVQ
jgi:hypothetical protein